jgi:YgiT-type zinc finger domain-containing protein
MNESHKQCHFCAGEMQKGKTTYTLNGSGYHLLIDDVPAWVCRQCNEEYFEENAVDIIQEIIKKLDTQVNKIRFKQQVDAGLKELDEGKGIPQEEVEEWMAGWLTGNGNN